jgi:hypothetical protein
MYFRQLKPSRTNKPLLFIIWKNTDNHETLSYGGGDVLDEYAEWDWFTNGNKLSFKLQLIY